MQRLTVYYDCDLDGEPATHVQVPVTIGQGAEPRTLDLCDHCHDRLLGPVLAALAEHGADPVTGEPPAEVKARRRPGTKWVRGPLKCEIPDCVSAPHKNRKTLQQHLHRVHDLTIDAYVAEYGEPAPLTPQQQAAIAVEVGCLVKDCPKVYSTERGNPRPETAMIQHMWRVHQIKWKPGQSLRAAKAATARAAKTQ